MPYFSWTGVNMVGDWQKGKRFAKSVDHLDDLLFRQGIALIRNKPMRWLVFYKPIKRADLSMFFEQLSALISAGILVPQALALVADQFNNPRLQEVLYMLADAVQAGDSLSNAMTQHAKIFDLMIVQYIKIGEESGNLSAALQSLSVSLETTEAFHAQVRSALIMPMIGVAFFICIAAIIFFVIIPQFADLFTAARQDMPWLTRMVLSLNRYCTGWYGIAGIGMIGLLIVLMRSYLKSSAGRKRYTTIALHIPFVGPIMRTRLSGLFFQSMAMLLAGGMRIVPALRVMSTTQANPIFVKHLEMLEYTVSSGSSLSQAMAQQRDDFFAPHVVAMVAVGEETGQLAPLLDKIASNYRQEVKKQLTLCTVLLQPLLLLLLGGMVIVLVLAVYGPILNLASGIRV